MSVQAPYLLVGIFCLTFIFVTTGGPLLVALAVVTAAYLLRINSNNLSHGVRQPLENKLPNKTNHIRRYQTYRISNIPISVAKDDLCEALAERSPNGNLVSFSYTFAVASTLASSYRVATVTFDEAPEIKELQKFLRAHFGRDASRLRVDADFFGLTPLYLPSHDIKVE